MVGSCAVNEGDEIMCVRNNGQLIRTRVVDIPVRGRATKGVILTRLGKGERIEICMAQIEPAYRNNRNIATEKIQS